MADKNKKETKSAASISKTFGGSPVTSNQPEKPSSEKTIDLSSAKITVPVEAIESAPATVETEDVSFKDFEARDNSFAQRAIDASIGLIKVDGIDFRYVGRSPAHPDENVKLDTGLQLSSLNTTFTPLSEVQFDPTIRVYVGGEFFFPQNAASWADVENSKGAPLVPREANKEATKARFAALFS